MFNKISKINTSAVPAQARANAGPATVGIEYDAATGKGLVIAIDNTPTRVLVPSFNVDSATLVGAKNGATVSQLQSVVGINKTVLTLAALPLTLLDASQGLGVKVYDFPQGRILFLGAFGAVKETTTSTLASTLNAGVTYNWGLGSTTQVNGTLATTEQNIIPSTNGTASATINVEAAVSKGQLAADLQLDGTVTAVDMFFNVGIATATDIDGDATTTWNGTLTFYWANLGIPA